MHTSTKNFINNKLPGMKANASELMLLVKKTLKIIDELAYKNNYREARIALATIVKSDKSKDTEKKSVKEQMREKAGIVLDEKMYCAGKEKMYSVGKGKECPECGELFKGKGKKCKECIKKTEESFSCKYCGQSYIDESVKNKHQLLCSL